MGVRRRPARRRAPPPCVRPEDGDVLMTDGPFAEGKEHLGGFSIIEAPDLDAALEWGRKARRARPRCRSRCGRSRTCTDRMPAVRRTSSVSSARSTAARSPSWSASSATSTSPRRRSRTRSPSAVRALAGRRRCRRARPAGSSPPPATGRSTGCAARRPATDRHAQAALLHAARRAGRGGTRARRPAAPDLHLLPPGARPRRPGRADPAAARRPDDAGDRPRVPRARADDGPAARPGQGARSATPASRTGCPREAELPDRLRGGARRRLPDLQRGLHGQRRATRWSATTCAPRRSGSAGCWPS